PLFGNAKPKISISASVWSPMDALSSGSVPYGEELAGHEEIETVLRQLLVHERDEIFYYIGICSTSGWEDDLFEMPPDGINYAIALIEPRFPGWAVSAPETWPLAVQAAFQPDTIEDMRKRLLRIITTHPELEEEGGLLLVSELAEHTGVPEAIVLEEVEVYCAAGQGLVLEFVEGSHIVRRIRS
ncbi:MAG: hypothetical protein KDB07_13455, partial [Planctomycetes bacterium]|nr:hypothetical protein [Planctomycetota bacterium]